MAIEAKKRDRHLTRQIHKLFWEANFQSKTTLILCYFGRVPGSFIINAAIPLLAASGVQAIIQHNTAQVYTNAWMIVGLSVLYALLSLLGGVAVSHNAIRGSEYLMSKVFDNYLDKDYEFYVNRFTGALGEQVMRLKSAYNDYGEMVTALIPSQFVVIVGGIVVVGWQSIELALITLAAIIFVVMITVVSNIWRMHFRRQVSEANSLIAGVVGDALGHGATVKSFASGDQELVRLQTPLKKWSAAQFKSWVSFEPTNALRAISVAIIIAVILVVSSNLYTSGRIPVAIVVLVQLFVIRLVVQTIQIADIVKRYEEIMSAAYEPLKTMLEKPTILDSASPKPLPKGKLELALNDVTFHYNESHKTVAALKKFSLTIKPGEKIGIVGYSGSGKTTLTKLLLRFMDVSSGNISLGGVDIRELRQKDLRTTISYVPQEPLLFHRTIAENIGYGLSNASTAAIKKVAKLAYVDEFADELPQGYETLVGERGIKLSGGQRQRVAIARALLKNAPILVLDEATSALDSRSEKYIQDALWKLMKGRTAIVIAHRLSTIQRMDRIVVLNKGKIIQIGMHDELRSQPGIYADLWAHQSGGYIGVPSDDDEED